MGRQKPNLIFGQNLRRLMDERRIRLSHLSQEIEIPKSTVHSWMYGGNPRDLIALKQLADYFSLSVDELCFGELSNKSKDLQTIELDPQNNDRINIGLFEVILLQRRK